VPRCRIPQIGACNATEDVRRFRLQRDALLNSFPEWRDLQAHRCDHSTREAVETLAEDRHQTGAEPDFEPWQRVVVIHTHEPPRLHRALVDDVREPRSVHPIKAEAEVDLVLDLVEVHLLAHETPPPFTIDRIAFGVTAQEMDL